MVMTPRLRKFALTAHLTCSVGWIGAVMAYLALVVAAMISQDSRTLQAAWIAMELIGWYVIVPLALASLLSGLVMALGTPWGLFRHYWVLFSLVLTILATVVLLVHMQTVSDIAGRAAETPSAAVGGPAGRIRPRRCRHAGVARDPGAEYVQAARHDPVRVAEAAGAAYGVASGNVSIRTPE